MPVDEGKSERVCARVFGTPVCKEFGDYMDKADRHYSTQRVAEMFFAGPINMIIPDLAGDDDFDEIIGN